MSVVVCTVAGNAMRDALEGHGFENVQTISTTQETVVFAQPRELRI